jgi:hypothetical protein
LVDFTHEANGSFAKVSVFFSNWHAERVHPEADRLHLIRIQRVYQFLEAE